MSCRSRSGDAEDKLGRDDMRVVAVIATYNRAEVLCRTLDAVEAQERLPDEIVVVDNASTDNTIEIVRNRYPAIRCIELGDNRGAGAALAVGMNAIADTEPDAFWLLDDDTQPAPAALRVLLETVERTADLSVGIVALSGGVFRHGIVNHLPAEELPRAERAGEPIAGLRFAEFVVYDGGLVTRAAVERVGYPRDDFFLTFDDLEYAMRVHEAGMQLVVLEEGLASRMHLGSGGDGSSTPPWRGYYLTRNHLRAALDRRSPALLYGWLVRNVKFVVGTLLHGDRKAERLRLRALAVYHAITGRLGRRVDPGP
jgi:GT2 family glycosyltransferase